MRSDYLHRDGEHQKTVLATGVVMVAAVGVAIAIGAAAWASMPPLTGRLHPGLVPGGLAVLLAVCAIGAWRGRSAAGIGPAAGSDTGDESEEETDRQAGAASLRSLATAALAVLVLAFGTRTLGIALTVLLAATLTSSGVAGVTAARAAAIGVAFSVAVSLLSALASRQPLPILPRPLAAMLAGS